MLIFMVLMFVVAALVAALIVYIMRGAATMAALTVIA
jgi:hypothetical protein